MQKITYFYKKKPKTKINKLSKPCQCQWSQNCWQHSHYHWAANSLSKKAASSSVPCDV